MKLLPTSSRCKEGVISSMEKFQAMSDSEIEIMQIIWANKGSILFAELLNELESKQKNWKPNTVLTFLARLSDKGILTTEKKGRLNVYISLVSENDYLEAQAKTFLDKVYGGNVKGLISALLKSDGLSSQDFDELKTFWNEGGDVNK